MLSVYGICLYVVVVFVVVVVVHPNHSPEIQVAVVCRFRMYLRFNGLYNELCIFFGSHCTVHLFYIYVYKIFT